MDLAEVSPLTVVECPRCQAPQTVFQRFGPFQLDCLLGTGGMGAVYRATDIALHRPIALKVLQKKLSHDASLTNQFEREAALTARINHPNVVRVYSTGSAHGMFYIAMELVDTGSLESLMEQRGRLEEAEVLKIGIQIAEGLQAASRAGLIHRDIKPGNILFTKDRQAKIVDFGLALQSNQAHTPNGEIWGTPFYIAPEALAFQPEDLRSDMYALGSTLWHALTGAPPYLCSSVSVHELLHMKKQPVDLHTAFPAAHPLTANALNRTLAFARNERPPDYAALLADLHQAITALNGTPNTTTVREPSPRKIRPGRVATVTVLLAASVGAGWWLLRVPNPIQPEPLAEPAYQTDAERLARSARLLQKDTQIDLALQRLELVFNSPGLSPELQLWVGISLGTGHGLRGDFSKQVVALKSALAAAPTAPPELTLFATRLLAVASRAPLPENVIAEDPFPQWESLRQLWLGLRDISRNALADGESALKKVAQPTPTQGDPAEGLLPLAGLLLEQFKTFHALEQETAHAWPVGERGARLRHAEELASSIQLSIPLRNQAAGLLAKAKATPAEQAQIAQAPAKPSQAESVGLPPEMSQQPRAIPAPPLAPASAAVEALRAQMCQSVQFFRFKDAIQQATSFKPATSTEDIARARLQRQVLTVESLFQWALQEINRGGTLPSPVLRNGSAFKSDPIKADERQLLVQVVAGTAPVPIEWKEISPVYLVKLVQFRLSTLPSSPQRAELLWGAGHVHLLLGSKQNAKPFLEEAVKINPAYGELLTVLLTAESNP